MNDIEILLNKILTKLTFTEERLDKMILREEDIIATSNSFKSEAERLKALVIALRQEIVLLQGQVANAPTKELFDENFVPRVQGFQEIQ